MSGYFDFLLALGEPLELEVGRGAWPPKQEALRVRATGGMDENELIFRLNALGDGSDAELRPRPATADTMAAQSAFFASSCTNERSIFILSNGNMRR